MCELELGLYAILPTNHVRVGLLSSRSFCVSRNDFAAVRRVLHGPRAAFPASITMSFFRPFSLGLEFITKQVMTPLLRA
ncbi:hypothetical protein E2C01_085694 [Portunus trituberculatus]|uniref:Uncharacterized protein n=1 Tax=Portunus trituberculatus TaxID=210409 RepID=A0A5B7JBD5_PORTR|nr:hypothetical protein [Portunus trituberculatus]